MIDRELEAKIELVTKNGSSDECFQLSCELSRRAEELFSHIWPGPVRYSKWEVRAARRQRVHGSSLESKANGDYLARHKWPKYKRQFQNYKWMMMLSVAASEMMQLGHSRLEGLR